MNKVSLALCAAQPSQTKGRLFKEPESEERSVYQRDRDRIIHSSAFRLMKSKTQVFVYHEGESFRTRLTHSLEVSQIARSIARRLSLNEDLTEALALAHDIGHPPFGHAGERVLKEKMKDYGGFDHNSQALRIVTKIEKRYAEFDGLNLTWETLEGTVKHNGPLLDNTEISSEIKEYSDKQNLRLDTYPSIEAQIAALSDDIAYNNHDIDDGFHAGLFTIDELSEIAMLGVIIKDLRRKYKDIDDSTLVHETVKYLIHAMVDDLSAETRKRYIGFGLPQSSDEIRLLNAPVAGFSEVMQKNDKELKDFLFPHMYRHYKVMRMTSKSKKVIADLFDLFLEEPRLLPDKWRAKINDNKNKTETARIVCDYISGMTDSFAVEEYIKLFDPKVRP